MTTGQPRCVTLNICLQSKTLYIYGALLLVANHEVNVALPFERIHKCCRVDRKSALLAKKYSGVWGGEALNAAHCMKNKQTNIFFLQFYKRVSWWIFWAFLCTLAVFLHVYDVWSMNLEHVYMMCVYVANWRFIFFFTREAPKIPSSKIGNVYRFYVCRPLNELYFHFIFHRVIVFICVCARFAWFHTHKNL